MRTLPLLAFVACTKTRTFRLPAQSVGGLPIVVFANVGPMPVPNNASSVRPAPRRICGRSSALQRATSLPFSLGQGALPPTSSQRRLPLHEVVSRVGTLCLELSKLLHILTLFLFYPPFFPAITITCNRSCAGFGTYSAGFGMSRALFGTAGALFGTHGARFGTKVRDLV